VQIIGARNAAGVCAKARVVGVAFFDYKHGQTGVRRTRSSCTRCSALPASPDAERRPSAASSRGESLCRLLPRRLHPAAPPELNCADIPFRNFRVRWDVANPDPQGFDGDRDGVGCES